MQKPSRLCLAGWNMPVADLTRNSRELDTVIGHEFWARSLDQLSVSYKNAGMRKVQNLMIKRKLFHVERGAKVLKAAEKAVSKFG